MVEGPVTAVVAVKDESTGVADEEEGEKEERPTVAIHFLHRGSGLAVAEAWWERWSSPPARPAASAWRMHGSSFGTAPGIS
jgi:hypothetical protein